MKRANRIKEILLGLIVLVLLLGWTQNAGAAPFAYVVNTGANSVSVIDTATNTLVQTVPVGGFGGTVAVAVHPDGTRVYVTTRVDDVAAISVIETRTNSVVSTVTVTNAVDVVVSPDGIRVYVVNRISDDGTVSVIDTATNSVIDIIDLFPFSEALLRIAINPAGTRLYVTDHERRKLLVIDPVTKNVSAIPQVGQLGLDPIDVAVHPDGTRVYVADHRVDKVFVIDTAANDVVAEVQVAVSPGKMAFDPAGTRLYVTNTLPNSVSVIDTATNTVVGTVPLGGAPAGIAMHPDGTRAYVTIFDANSVSVIDTTTNTAVGTVPVGVGPGAIAIGPLLKVVDLVDPVPNLLSGPAVVNDTTFNTPLATQGRIVEGVAADGVTQLVLRIRANFVGEQLSLSMFNDQATLSGSTDEDGGLRTITDDTLESTIMVSAVDTTAGPMAFAIYRAPTDFPRQSGLDQPLGVRNVFIHVESLSVAGFDSVAPIRIVRPPVILVHGIWGSPSNWDTFMPLTSFLTDDANFFIRRVDYGFPISITSSTPTYPSGTLARARTNSLGFAFNAVLTLGQIRIFLEEFKNSRNPTGIKVAAVQADLVAHSMGGDVSRTLPLTPNFFGPTTFGKGVIHKLITIGTPHLGSPLAIQLLQNANSCVRNVLASNRSISFSSVTSMGRIINGGVFDLQGDGVAGGTLSDALTRLQQTLPGSDKLRTGLIAGLMSQDQLNGLSCAICAADYIRLRCFTNPLAQNFNPASWPSVFGQDSDAIVPLTSQLNALQGSQFTAVHSRGAVNLGFGPPHELQEASGIPGRVRELLNTQIKSSSYSLVSP